MLDLTIVIPTMNTTGDRHQDKKLNFALNHCLLSLNETVPDVPVIIASNNGDPKYIAEYNHNNCTRINIWEQGQCKAVNAAVAMVKTEYVMVTNDDMVFSKNWYDVFRNTDYQCASPKLVEPIDGAPTFIKYFCGGADGDFDKQKFEEFAEFEHRNIHASSAFVSGFNLPFIINKRLWDLIGGYDVNYDPWGSNSDSDLLYKIRLAGIQPIQRQGSLVYHFSQTSGTFHPSHRDAWQRNWDYFIEKWGFPRTDDRIWEADFEIPYEKLKFKPLWASMP